MKTTITILLLFIGSIAMAQENFQEYQFEKTETYIIKLIDDESEFIGAFIEKNGLSVSIKTNSLPKVEIPFSKIKSIEKAPSENIKNGKYWFQNPNPTRYLFGPSAFGLKKGTGYYQNSYLLINSFNYGLTDNITIGGGFEFITLINGNPVFFITPKITFPVAKKVNIGAGLLYVNSPKFFDDSRSQSGIAYGIGTYGTPEHNITGGLGWGFIEGTFSSKPIITISGMTRVGKRFALITENWIVPTVTHHYNTNSYEKSYEYHGLYSYGVRFFGKKMAVDLALMNNKDISEALLLGFPYIDFVVQF